MAKLWLIKDNEAGKILRFAHKSVSWKPAMEAYVRFIAPWLTKTEVEESASDFNGEIWAADDIIDIVVK